METQVYEQGVPYNWLNHSDIEYTKEDSNQEYPLRLNGPFNSEKVEIDLSKTSQFHSALLLMAPRTEGFELVTYGDAVSRNHSALTWELCRQTGAKLRVNHGLFLVQT